MTKRRFTSRAGQTTTDYALIIAFVAILLIDKMREVDLITQEQIAYTTCALIIANNAQDVNALDNAGSSQDAKEAAISDLDAQFLTLLRDRKTFSGQSFDDASAAAYRVYNRINAVLNSLKVNTVTATSSTE